VLSTVRNLYLGSLNTSLKQIHKRTPACESNAKRPLQTHHEPCAEGVWGAPLAPQWGSGGSPQQRFPLSNRNSGLR
jgi:hypothetical protein